MADFVDVGAVDSDGLVEDLAGDVELFGPVGDVGGDLGIDLFGVAGALGVLRIGNIKELQPYFYFWQSIADRLKKGVLAVIEVEQDNTINTLDLRDFIPSGFDGNSKKKAKKKSAKKVKK